VPLICHWAPSCTQSVPDDGARDDLRIDDEVKLFFLTSIALHDTAVASWDAKYHYDYIRPITAIRALGDVRLQAWQPRHLPVAFAYSAPAFATACSCAECGLMSL
jgi:hypothetical protein